MNCPNCKDILIVLELDEVEIDFCTSCNGIWLDSGELELLVEDNDKSDFKKIFIPHNGINEKLKKCPRCKKKMNKVEVGEKEKIVLDECKKGHGFWFDADELQSVINKVSKENGIINLLNSIFDYDSNTEMEES